ncbi:hypothetical protein [Ilumatobacter coccineus]|jgi:hypothetical protein|uniref:Uncharacterized protein n=1 Tax=Ilumatobacter coccineus (strain NBRC 103263 / KCTC 29153 / YM16-304) TaxID=1313172 RepID=A0A6C7EGP8_ILUCY|nr:hypothetical protein [Ilumatobacter coccineus]BAN03778.1 hypothetical protein YM304_34640 [Ilumatobacter coccineus YM16-304]
MKFFRRRPSDDDLLSWLETGEPRRVDKLLDDPDTTDRLERLTALPADDLAALHDVVEPADGFAERAESAVQTRVGDLQRVGTLFGLLGLGAETAKTLTSDDELS